jgi:hypothetical protein
MIDETESYRRERQAQLNKLGHDFSKEEVTLLIELVKAYGKVWDLDGLREEFEVLGFMAPLVLVRRKADDKKGTLEFIHSPRLYFNWMEDQ